MVLIGEHEGHGTMENDYLNELTSQLCIQCWRMPCGPFMLGRNGRAQHGLPLIIDRLCSHMLMCFTRSLADSWLIFPMKRSNDKAAVELANTSSSAMAALSAVFYPCYRAIIYLHTPIPHAHTHLALPRSDLMAARLPPFHLAFPVRDVQEAKEFYIEWVA